MKRMELSNKEGTWRKFNEKLSRRCAKYRKTKSKDLRFKTDFTPVFKESIRLNRKLILFSFDWEPQDCRSYELVEKHKMFEQIGKK